jgi:hypothetical protein
MYLGVYGAFGAGQGRNFVLFSIIINPFTSNPSSFILFKPFCRKLIHFLVENSCRFSGEFFLEFIFWWIGIVREKKKKDFEKHDI